MRGTVIYRIQPVINSSAYRNHYRMDTVEGAATRPVPLVAVRRLSPLPADLPADHQEHPGYGRLTLGYRTPQLGQYPETPVHTGTITFCFALVSYRFPTRLPYHR